jgi:hypothetical protein
MIHVGHGLLPQVEDTPVIFTRFILCIIRSAATFSGIHGRYAAEFWLAAQEEESTATNSQGVESKSVRRPVRIGQSFVGPIDAGRVIPITLVLNKDIDFDGRKNNRHLS